MIAPRATGSAAAAYGKSERYRHASACHAAPWSTTRAEGLISLALMPLHAAWARARLRRHYATHYGARRLRAAETLRHTA